MMIITRTQQSFDTDINKKGDHAALHACISINKCFPFLYKIYAVIAVIIGAVM